MSDIALLWLGSLEDLCYENQPWSSLDNNLKHLIPIINFDSVFNVLFPQCVTHKKKSCVYFSNFPYIHLFP